MRFASALRTLRPDICAVCAHVLPQGSSWVADHKKAVRLRNHERRTIAVTASQELIRGEIETPIVQALHQTGERITEAFLIHNLAVS